MLNFSVASQRLLYFPVTKGDSFCIFENCQNILFHVHYRYHRIHNHKNVTSGLFYTEIACINILHLAQHSIFFLTLMPFFTSLLVGNVLMCIKYRDYVRANKTRDVNWTLPSSTLIVYPSRNRQHRTLSNVVAKLSSSCFFLSRWGSRLP